MKHIIETYSCDLCGKKLETYNNKLNIVTEIREENPWMRLHVRIIRRHGMHNDITEESAELCKDCVVKLLTDAVKRVKEGERATAGVESIEMGTWQGC